MWYSRFVLQFGNEVNIFLHSSCGCRWKQIWSQRNVIPQASQERWQIFEPWGVTHLSRGGCRGGPVAMVTNSWQSAQTVLLQRLRVYFSCSSRRKESHRSTEEGHKDDAGLFWSQLDWDRKSCWGLSASAIYQDKRHTQSQSQMSMMLRLSGVNSEGHLQLTDMPG